VVAHEPDESAAGDPKRRERELEGSKDRATADRKERDDGESERRAMRSVEWSADRAPE